VHIGLYFVDGIVERLHEIVYSHFLRVCILPQFFKERVACHYALADCTLHVVDRLKHVFQSTHMFDDKTIKNHLLKGLYLIFSSFDYKLRLCLHMPCDSREAFHVRNWYISRVSEYSKNSWSFRRALDTTETFLIYTVYKQYHFLYYVPTYIILYLHSFYKRL